MHLSWIDYAIVLVYLGVTILVGLLSRTTIKGIADFLVAGRALKTHMAVATIVSTGLGLVTVMYFAEEGFKNGFSPFIVGLIAALATLIVGRTGFLVRRLRQLQVMTVPEFYEIRYSRGVRLTGGILLALAGTLNMGLFPILGSKFVVGFTGLPPEWINYVMVAMLAVVVFYTLMGGMVSVVLTDFAQFVLLSLGFLVGTVVILTHPQLGWSNIISSIDQHKGGHAFDPIANPDYGWMFIVYFMAVSLITIIWQPEMSRPLSTESPRVAQRIFWISSVTFMGRAVVPMFFGAAAFAYVHSAGYTGQYADDGLYAMPEMLSQVLPVGVAGLLMAGMFAAFMSTHDSYLLAWSGVIVRDVISPLKAMLRGSEEERKEDGTWGGLTSQREIYWTRICVVLLAAFLAIFGIYYEMPESAFKFMYITGTIYFAGAVGAVGLGLYWKKANAVGAYCALILGAICPINFLVMNMFPEHVPEVLLPLVETSNLSALLALILGGSAMIVGSLLTQKTHPPRQLDFSHME